MDKLERLLNKIGEFLFWVLLPCVLALPFLFLAAWIVKKFAVFPTS